MSEQTPDAMDAAWERISHSVNRIPQADNLRVVTKFDLANAIGAYITAAEAALIAALPFLSRPAPSQSEGRKMIWNDGRACWLFPDGSHRGITKADAEQITHWQEHLAAVRAEATLAGAAAEREACAKLIEENSILFCSEGLNQLRPRMDGDRTGLDYATAIRARA